MKRRNFLGGLGAVVAAAVIPKPVRAEEYFEKLKADVEGNNPEVLRDKGGDVAFVSGSYSTASTSITGIYGPPMPDSLLKVINEDKKLFDDLWGGSNG